MKLNIGNVELKNNILLAPMAGVTDKSFRGICAGFGCGLTYTEMISAKGLNYHNKNTKALLDIHENEKTVAVQLFGSDEKILGEMAAMLNEYAIDIIDINMGCPAGKITKNGEGSALMKCPQKVGKIVASVSKHSQKAVTVKIRKGFDEEHINAVEIAKIIEDNGASAVTVHGRTREQFYSGTADWDIIAAVKNAVTIPVIGNGDIVDPITCEKMFKHTNCDGVMIGRAAQGNPWIFKEILTYFVTGERIAKPSWPEKIQVALKQAQETINHKGEHIGVLEMRKQLSWYVKGMDNAAELRLAINKLQTYDEMEQMFSQYLKHNQ